MEVVQNRTTVTYDELPEPKKKWVDFCAVQGLITMDDGTPKKISVEQFADMLGVGRRTLYDWKDGIPNFMELVKARSKIIFSGTRTIKVWNSVYVAATSKLDTRAQAIWLANADPNFVMPSQNVKHELGNSWAALLQAKRSTTDNIIEAEVISEPTKSIE